MSNKTEILAPAGRMESVVAAVCSGADAIYVGSKRFSARARANNFDDDELRECIRYCHAHNVKVYLALNTLIFDEEMEEALQLAKDAARMDIDAIIVQDIGLAMLIKKAIPDLPLHASTQMCVHTSNGAKALYDMGFQRVVLARELSLDEIKVIHHEHPEIELEVFIDGALCYCVSGQCYFSAMLGGRSANRGRCAQTCRLPMRFGNVDHALSMKENGGTPFLRDLEGITSAKIEGRLKRPEEVALAVQRAVNYRKNGRYGRVTARKTGKAFCGPGETDGYLCGMRGRDMFGTRQKADPAKLEEVYKEVRQSYKDEPNNVPVDMIVRLYVGEKPKIVATTYNDTVTIEGDQPIEKAGNKPTTRDAVKQCLSKTGGTPYYINDLNVWMDDDVYMPVSALNALRRKALEELDEIRRKLCHQYTIHDFDIREELESEPAYYDCEDWYCSPNLDLPEELKGKGIVFVALEGLTDLERVRRMMEDGWRIGVELPRVAFNGYGSHFLLEELILMGVLDIMAHTIDAAAWDYENINALWATHAGFGMNIANSWSLKWAKDHGFTAAEVSAELTLKQIERLKKCIPVGVIRYGYFPLMISRNSPGGLEVPCNTASFLQDRKNKKFRVIPHEEYTEILNSVPIILPQKDYPVSDGVFDIIRFTVENSVDNKEKTLEKLRENDGFTEFTHGLYLRGVK